MVSVERQTWLEVDPAEPDVKEYKLDFTLHGTDVSMANALRRTMIAEVPTMAIELVTVLVNKSPLHDEYIAHRLGLIPLESTNIHNFKLGDDCECEGYCPKCAVEFELDQTCDKDSTESLIITSKHLVNCNESDARCVMVKPVHSSGDPKAPGALDGADEGIVIIKLAPGQQIHMQMIAKKGIGKDHAKWSPMCSVAYRIEPPPVSIDLTQLNKIFSVDVDTKKKIVELAEGLLRLDVDTELLEYEQPFLLRRIGITQDTIRRISEFTAATGHSASGVIKYNKAEKFEFSAETTGAMPPARALRMALDILSTKLNGCQALL